MSTGVSYETITQDALYLTVPTSILLYSDSLSAEGPRHPAPVLTSGGRDWKPEDPMMLTSAGY